MEDIEDILKSYGLDESMIKILQEYDPAMTQLFLAFDNWADRADFIDWLKAQNMADSGMVPGLQIED